MTFSTLNSKVCQGVVCVLGWPAIPIQSVKVLSVSLKSLPITAISTHKKSCWTNRNCLSKTKWVLCHYWHLCFLSAYISLTGCTSVLLHPEAVCSALELLETPWNPTQIHREQTYSLQRKEKKYWDGWPRYWVMISWCFFFFLTLKTQLIDSLQQHLLLA